MIKIDVRLPLFYNSEDMISAVTSALPVAREEIRESRIVKRALVLDDRSDIHYKASIALAFSEEREIGLLAVSHSMPLLEKVCTRLVDMEKDK